MHLDAAETEPSPWFRRRPRLAVCLALVLFALVFVLRLTVGDSRDAISLLFALPIALLAVSRGLLAGVGGGILAVVLVIAWTALTGTELSVLGWASRVVPLLLVGGLLGDASDRLRRSDLRRRQLELAALRHHQALEINDSLVQGMAAAKWALEAGRAAEGLETLDDTISHGQQLVSALLREADMGPVPRKDQPHA